ncbi:hypothetical protein KY284_000933 [Solanum tuberosum]|nr:hypothetical protein KY284_000933 [Solanum tuberosum]
MMEHLKFYWRSLEYLVYYAEKFETLHSCRGNGLALCGGPSLRQSSNSTAQTSSQQKINKELENLLSGCLPLF